MNRSADRLFKLLPAISVSGILCILFGCSFAEAITIDEILSRMRAADENAKVLEFNFTQQIKFSLTGETQTKSGEMTFRKPDNIRIVQKKPAEQLMVGDGRKIWVYTPSYGQAVVDDWKKWLKNNELVYVFFGLARSFKEFESNYRFRYVSKNEKGFLLSLEPRKKDFPRMTLVVDDVSFIPVQTNVILGNTEITSDIDGLKVNPQINKDTFKFRAPDKTEVIRLN